MPLFINRDQIFAHQVHLLEHKLRSKEERILELETENALLHLRLAECLGKLRRDHEDVAEAQKRCQHQKNITKSTQTALAKLLSEVQVLKQDLRDVFAVYVGFATELEGQSKQLLERVVSATSAVQGDGEDVQALQAKVEALERSLQEEKERCRTERLRRKLLHNALVELRGNIRVHCRVRPVLPFDAGFGQSGSVSGSTLSEEVVHAVNDDTVVVNCSKAGNSPVNKMFEFERVHSPEDTQEDVFEEVKPLLTSLLDGYNVCIMAYGQTGSGKTHTMIGSQNEDPMGPEGAPLQGVIPKAATELFRLISEKPADSHTVEVSVVEVYNNEVFDLLSKDGEGAGAKRDVITTSTGTSEVTSLTYESVRSSAEVMQVISAVLRLRARSPTLVHRDSSRSHLIVTLTVTSKSPNVLALARRLQSARQEVQRPAQKEWWSPRCRRAASGRRGMEEQPASPASSPLHSPCHSPCPSPRPSISQAPVRTKLQLVDLAGSECVGMSGVTGAALWETSCINRSLSALSDVLGALAEQRPHVPYRNSKLTHLLQDSIGGDAKLLVMLCVSPTQRFMAESLQSLGFGTRARQVQREPARRKNAALKTK
ncbi:kinesin-like protein KIF25 [Megalops cyprinoides]|uniref:kinesin-like protein KIF25 n=1 Tax=Megalops cyprinoides TaxID=118141 RepID=UPI001864141C|nr:kinesin-like protein KIF25 [Megalops cyprinoides]